MVQKDLALIAADEGWAAGFAAGTADHPCNAVPTDRQEGTGLKKTKPLQLGTIILRLKLCLKVSSTRQLEMGIVQLLLTSGLISGSINKY